MPDPIPDSLKQFDVIIEGSRYQITVHAEDINHGQGFFRKMDRDMDGGKRMGPEFVYEPDGVQRCQIVAERLLLAMENQNETMQRAMSAYITWRIPDISELHIDTSGDPSLTQIVTR